MVIEDGRNAIKWKQENSQTLNLLISLGTLEILSKYSSEIHRTLAKGGERNSPEPIATSVLWEQLEGIKRLEDEAIMKTIRRNQKVGR